MTTPVCIDRDKIISRLRIHYVEMVETVKAMPNEVPGDRKIYETGLSWILGCIDLVSRSYRVTHEVGTCSWTHTMDRDAGMVKYESQCGHVTEFYETVKGMEFKFCPFCGCRIVEEE